MANGLTATDTNDVQLARYEAEHGRVRLAGSLTTIGAGRLRAALHEAFRVGPVREVDLSLVERLEGGAAAVLADAWCEVDADPRPRFVGGAAHVRDVLGLYVGPDACAVRPIPKRRGFFDEVGAATIEMIRNVRALLAFIGEASLAILAAVRRPWTVAWGQVSRQMERHGADGLAIVGTIGLLIGLITAFQAAIQLRKFGADTLVATLVGLSLTRELAPLMTAIVVAGRSGAAIAAELGTMKVSEEVDALTTMGLCPYRYLVFPRLLALLLVLPLLTAFADIVGLLGGALVAISTLEVSLNGYILATQEALALPDVLGGLLKSVAFGGIIALVACERGLATEGGAEGVGHATTGAVVKTLFYLVVADAVFAVLFDLWGI
ncbi:MAG: MlaE family lipid ABC transporter permease subunit [Planctomycetota bacterium]